MMKEIVFIAENTTSASVDSKTPYMEKKETSTIRRKSLIDLEVTPRNKSNPCLLSSVNIQVLWSCQICWTVQCPVLPATKASDFIDLFSLHIKVCGNNFILIFASSVSSYE